MKSIIKLVGVIFMGVTVMNLLACTAIKTDVVGETKKQLQKKYGVEFDIISIGDRINTGTATMFAYQVGYDDEPFKVVYSSKDRKIKDHYVQSKISHKIGNMLEESCKDNQINVCCSVMLVNDDSSSEQNIEMSVEDFFDLYKVKMITIRTCMDASDMNADKCEKFLSSLIEVSNRCHKKIGVILYPMVGDGYSSCVEKINKDPSPSANTFTEFSEGKEIIISAENGDVTIDANQLESSLKGE